MNGTNSQLFGSLSMKNGRSVRRCTLARLRYSSPSSRRSSSDSFSAPFGYRPAFRARPGCRAARRSFDLAVAMTRICSISVEPARGMPTMKIGSAASQPPGALVRKPGGELLDTAIDGPADLFGAIWLALQAKGVARRIMGEGLVGPAGVVHRLAQRKFEMEAVLVVELGGLQRRLHRRDIALVELHGLEIGEAPPGLAERRARSRSPCGTRRCLPPAGPRS